MRKITALFILFFTVFSLFFAVSCTVSYRDFSTTDGDTKAYFLEASYKAEKYQKDLPDSKSEFEIIMCKNETEGGQVVIRNDFGAIKNSSISVSTLTDESGNIIPPERVSIYRGKYMQLFALDQTGAYPDAMIPMKYEDLNFYTAEQGENLPYYIEIETVEDDIASVYTAQVTITFDSGKIDIPLTVRVYDITLPETPSTVMTISGPMDIEGIYAGKNIDARMMYYYFLLDYKFSLQWPTSDATTPETYLSGILPEVTDERVTAFLAPFYGEIDENGYYVFNVQKMQRLIELFRENGIMEKACWAVFDEPDTQYDFDRLAKFNQDLLSIAPDAHHSCAIAYQPQLLPDGLETWTLSWNSVKEPIVDAILEAGNRVWRYGTEETLIGNNNSIEAKIRFWHQEQLGITGYLQWAGDGFRRYNTESDTPGEEDKYRDIWSDPYYFYPVEDFPMYAAGGDSYLVYPGLQGDGVVNRDILIPTVRLTALRDGADDYDILKIRRAQIEKRLEEYGITAEADTYMSVYFDALNDITNNTAGGSVSNFDRYSAIKHRLLEDIVADSKVLFSVEIPDEDHFYMRDISIVAPEGSSVIINGKRVEQNGNIAETTVEVYSPVNTLSFNINGVDYSYTVYPKIQETGAIISDLSNIEALISANPRLPQNAFEYSDNHLLINFTDKVKTFSIPTEMLNYNDFSSQGRYLTVKFRNNSSFDISDIDVSFYNESARGYVLNDRVIVKSGEEKTVYFDLDSANVEYSDVTKLMITFAENANVEISEIRMVNIK